MSRECLNCKEIIPYKVKIDGVIRSLQRRKYCLKCNPYTGTRGRTSLVQVGKVSKSMKNYANWPEEWKKEHSVKVTARGNELKRKLVEYSGGSCCLCGYNKCLRALSFHHRNPEEKCFGLDALNLRNKSWEAITKEASKCDLLCIRCHLEIEDELINN